MVSQNDLDQAPPCLLLITGAKAPVIDADARGRLVRYIQRGGTIFSCGEGEAFNQGIRTLYAQLLPDRELKPVPVDHPIHTKEVHFDVRGIPLFMVHNGVRPLAIHCDQDLPAAWQSWKVVSQVQCFEQMVNLIVYVRTSARYGPSMLDDGWPAAPSAWPQTTVRLARLDCGRDWNAEPLAYERLARMLALNGVCRLEVVAPARPADLERLKPDLAVLAGMGPLEMTQADAEAVRRYIQGGGTLLVEAIAGNKPFAQTSAALLEDWYGKSCLRPPPDLTELTNVPGYAIEKPLYRFRTRRALGMHRLLNLRLVRLEGRAAVYYSAEDLTAGLLGIDPIEVHGYQPQTAYEVLRNLIILAK